MIFHFKKHFRLLKFLQAIMVILGILFYIFSRLYLPKYYKNYPFLLAIFFLKKIQSKCTIIIISKDISTFLSFDSCAAKVGL